MFCAATGYGSQCGRHGWIMFKRPKRKEERQKQQQRSVSIYSYTIFVEESAIIQFAPVQPCWSGDGLHGGYGVSMCWWGGRREECGTRWTSGLLPEQWGTEKQRTELDLQLLLQSFHFQVTTDQEILLQVNCTHTHTHLTQMYLDKVDECSPSKEAA